jgi:hypothetical protein
MTAANNCNNCFNGSILTEEMESEWVIRKLTHNHGKLRFLQVGCHLASCFSLDKINVLDI